MVRVEAGCVDDWVLLAPGDASPYAALFDRWRGTFVDSPREGPMAEAETGDLLSQLGERTLAFVEEAGEHGLLAWESLRSGWRHGWPVAETSASWIRWRSARLPSWP